MISYFLILLLMLCAHDFLPPTRAQLVPTIEKLALAQNGRTILYELESKISHMTPGNNGKRTTVASYRGQTLSRHSQLHLQKVHGILIVVGWGTLLPIGAIIARFFKWKQWFWCHVLCQTLGYIVGTIGWCIGIWLRTLSKHYLSKLQLALTIITFTIINLQILSVLTMRSNKEGGYRKWWNIWHHAIGYAAIGMVVVSILAGISTEKEAEILMKAYTVIIGVLIVVAVPLQMFRFKSTIKKQFMRMTTSLRRSQSI
ncbi:hypothetical protein HN51_065012 [Arachis hypogaea]|uniref:cytochrome b561 and DOMON domain-containing protein At5g47530-like n=1 Tax=Arachis ipaensis TaxID=130454 RepID=UPI0007AF00F2|nr:cytochrome b561 and DOMON domain-containing protein At5g47530-like [Arachis ipaensis]XP_025645917.1 cytochrome b561 and DOMON domain-containing protein At5g47530 [Arachis hypogaea]